MEKTYKKKRTGAKLKNKFSLAFFGIAVLLIIYSLSLVIPAIWGLYSSFKSPSDFFINSYSLPEVWCFENYEKAFFKFYHLVPSGDSMKKIYMFVMFFNSVLYAGGCTVAGTMCSCVMAYMCAKYRYKFNAVIQAIVIVTMVLPIVGSLPSQVQVAQALGLYDKIWGMWIMSANFLGIYFLLFYGVFCSLSSEYGESAFVDGASHFRVMFQIMFPLVKTTILLVGLLLFISYWNNYQTPMMFIPSHPTAAYGMFLFRFSLEQDLNAPPMQLAGSVLLFSPIFIIFMFTKDKLVGNLTAGGLKG